MTSGPITPWQIEEENVEAVTDLLFLGSKITEDGDCSHEIRRWLLLSREVMTNLDSVLESRDITLPTRVCLVKAFVSPVVTYCCWELDCKEGRAPKNWCLWTVVLEKTLESPLDCTEFKPVNPKGNQPWIFIGRTDAEAPIFWPSDAKSQLIGKDRDAGKDWNSMAKFEQAPEVGDGQGSLVRCSPWVTKSWTRLSGWTTAVLLFYRNTLDFCMLNFYSSTQPCWNFSFLLRVSANSIFFST